MAIKIIQQFPVITANKSFMAQLFENLIGNALKYYSASKPVIQISCKADVENYLFSVNDNGIGINSKY